MADLTSPQMSKKQTEKIYPQVWDNKGTEWVTKLVAQGKDWISIEEEVRPTYKLVEGCDEKIAKAMFFGDPNAENKAGLDDRGKKMLYKFNPLDPSGLNRPALGARWRIVYTDPPGGSSLEDEIENYLVFKRGVPPRDIRDLEGRVHSFDAPLRN